MSDPRIIHGMPEAEYHAHPALSSTGARLLLESPARFHYAQSHPQAHKDAFDLGTAVHTKVLGVGHETVVLDFPDFRTNAAKAARDEARANGQIVITAEQSEQVDAMAEAVLTHPTARMLFEQDGQAEASVFATDPETGVDLRARFDFLPDLANRSPIAVDLKTTAKSADKVSFEKTVADFGYETQGEWYTDTLSLATGADEIPFVFVVVETAPPHLIGVHQLDVVFRSMGRDKAKRAREEFAACTASGIWPGHPTDVQLISPPTWAIYQHEEKFS